MQNLAFSKPLAAEQTPIPGLLVFDLPVHGDSRGWFKENWQREKMVQIGLPDFNPVQNNISFNADKGVTRGIHAEPWDKYISVASGRVFGAWVDLREGDSFGAVYTAEIDPTKAIFVPRGVGNSFQALEDNTAYTYLVSEHWSADAQSQYTFLNLADTTVAIDWPISLDQVEISEKDKFHPELTDVTPMPPKKTLIIGANGQLGRALQAEFPNASCVDRSMLDISDPAAVSAHNWKQYAVVINAAAYTAVDLAETTAGRRDAWLGNAGAVGNLARAAAANHFTLVHVSSDYVFDGTQLLHEEDEDFNPLSVYGQTKAAGDLLAATAPQHYIVRTSWVIGDGNNFVKTMQALAEKGVKPSVVNDQIGRLTFTADLARAIKHLVTTTQPHGTYNVTNDGDSASWADIASLVYELSGHSPDDVTGVSTDEYYAGKSDIAPRPLQSTLNIAKIVSAGYHPTDWKVALKQYLNNDTV